MVKIQYSGARKMWCKENKTKVLGVALMAVTVAAGVGLTVATAGLVGPAAVAAAAGIGALTSAGVDVGTQIFESDAKSFSDVKIDWLEVGVQAGCGAITGFFSEAGLIEKVGSYAAKKVGSQIAKRVVKSAAQGALEGLIDATGSVVNDFVHGQDTDWRKAGVTWITSTVCNSVGHGFLDKYGEDEFIGKTVREKMNESGQYADGSTKATKTEMEELINKLKSRLENVTPGTEGYTKLDNRIKRIEKRMEKFIPLATKIGKRIAAKRSWLPSSFNTLFSIAEDEYLFQKISIFFQRRSVLHD